MKRLSGADERSRTADLLITNQLLYQLSYVSTPETRSRPSAGRRRGSPGRQRGRPAPVFIAKAVETGKLSSAESVPPAEQSTSRRPPARPKTDQADPIDDLTSQALPS